MHWTAARAFRWIENLNFFAVEIFFDYISPFRRDKYSQARNCFLIQPQWISNIIHELP